VAEAGAPLRSRGLALVAAVIACGVPVAFVTAGCGDESDAAPPADDASIDDGGVGGDGASESSAVSDADSDGAGDALAASDGAPDAPAAVLLSSQGLYADIATKTVVAGAVEYSPAYPLWSDGTQKRRWILLPAGAVIDTSDMDHWQVPVGTKFFKEFALGGKRIETRLIERRAATGIAGTDYFFSAFVWRSDESDAELATLGAKDALGTFHDVPSQAQCNACHGSDAAFILGFSAIQLSKGGASPTLKSLALAGTLSNPPPPDTDYPVPGDATTAAALGALHANCGHCHQTAGFAYDATHMVLRLSASERDAETSQAWLTTVGVPLDEWQYPGFATRVVSKDPAASAVVFRMQQRGTPAAMPPLGTELVDDAGVAAVSAWVSSLP
jgi:mono/diheme cytochrome c family protein